MLHKLKKKDFAVLRGPLESGRQSPDSLSGALFLSIFLQSLMYYLTYYAAASTTIFPNVEKIQTIHFWVTACIVFLCVIYSIPAIYNRSQKIQYLISILAVQNMGAACCYLSALFIVGDGEGITVASLVMFTKTTLAIGVLLFLATCIRFYILLRKGHYRNGSKKGQLRASFEATTYIPLAIVGSTGLVFVIQFMVRKFGWMGFEDTFIVVLGMGLFYTMIFVLPEQLVILYCKFRFNHFNFHKDGVLKRI